MTNALELIPSRVGTLDRPIHILPGPWRDPHTVSPEELKEYIGFLKKACQDNPESADLHTCLGMAYAMNYQAHDSMDVLEKAVKMDDTHFFAQLKYSELLYRLRALQRAEEETSQALNLAGNTWELSLARKQLQEIRRLRREGTQRPELNKPLRKPSITLMVMMVIITLAMVLFR